MSMDRIREWMEGNPKEKELRRKNKSYVFFAIPTLPATRSRSARRAFR
jgi:membrane-bound lytic murein transglycosylase